MKKTLAKAKTESLYAETVATNSHLKVFRRLIHLNRVFNIIFPIKLPKLCRRLCRIMPVLLNSSSYKNRLRCAAGPASLRREAARSPRRTGVGSERQRRFRTKGATPKNGLKIIKYHLKTRVPTAQIINRLRGRRTFHQYCRIGPPSFEGRQARPRRAFVQQGYCVKIRKIIFNFKDESECYLVRNFMFYGGRKRRSVLCFERRRRMLSIIVNKMFINTYIGVNSRV